MTLSQIIVTSRYLKSGTQKSKTSAETTQSTSQPVKQLKSVTKTLWIEMITLQRIKNSF